MSSHTKLRRVRTALAASCLAVASAASQAPVHPLDTVSVIASRTRIGDGARVVDVISRDDIARSSARNLADLLGERLSVDVYPRSPAQADISLRGSTAEQTLLLVDGIRVSDAQSSHYALDLAVPLDAIERIEILRGGGSALYGTDAVGGVINIVTRRGASEAALSARGGAAGTAGVAASGGAQRGAVAINGSSEYEKSDGYRAGTDYRIGQARAALSAPVGAGRLESHVGVGIRDFGANEFYGPYNSTERTGTVTADARWTVPVGGWVLSTTGSTRRHTDRFTLIRDNPAIYENLHTSWQSTGEVVGRTTVGRAELAVGADAQNDQLTSARLGSHAEWRDAAFAEVSAGSASTATLDVGVRADGSDTYGGFLSPSLGIAAPVTDAIRLRASASRGFRAPTWTELYYADPTSLGNSSLVPEQFWSGDAGARVGHAGALMLDVGVFARNAQNLIDWVKPDVAPATAQWVATNIGDARYRGVEASLFFPAWRGVESSLGATGLDFTDSQGAGLKGKYALRPLTRQVTARASWSPWSPVRATVELMNARRATEDGYLTGNVRLEWRLQRTRITLDAQNLTNAAWLDASGVIVEGRALFLGVEWRR